jgi:hypothetical protein
LRHLGNPVYMATWLEVSKMSISRRLQEAGMHIINDGSQFFCSLSRDSSQRMAGTTASCNGDEAYETYTSTCTLAHHSDNILLIINKINADAADLKSEPNVCASMRRSATLSKHWLGVR